MLPEGPRELRKFSPGRLEPVINRHDSRRTRDSARPDERDTETDHEQLAAQHLAAQHKNKNSEQEALQEPRPDPGGYMDKNLTQIGLQAPPMHVQLS